MYPMTAYSQEAECDVQRAHLVLVLLHDREEEEAEDEHEGHVDRPQDLSGHGEDRGVDREKGHGHGKRGDQLAPEAGDLPAASTFFLLDELFDFFLLLFREFC